MNNVVSLTELRDRALALINRNFECFGVRDYWDYGYFCGLLDMAKSLDIISPDDYNQFKFALHSTEVTNDE